MKGVIVYTDPKDLEHLRSLGITIKKIAPNSQTRPEHFVWDAFVELDEEALNRLDPFWNKYIWSIEE